MCINLKCSIPYALGIKIIIVLLSLFSGTTKEAEASSADYQVISITTLTIDSGRIDWSPDGQWIYYDHKEDDYYYDVHRIHPDGTGEICLTCNHPDLPNRHQGQPEMHPDGRWLLFQAEKPSHWEDSWDYNPCKPGGGYYNDLYVMDLESSPPYDVHQLTDVRDGNPPPGGSLHPHFNHDGTRLLWGDLEGTGGRFGDWRMAVADFKTNPFPHLENHSYYNPGDNPLWFETHGWGPDDSWIYFSGTPLSGADDFAGDICRMDFSNPGVATRLTWTSGTSGEEGQWDEHAHLSPLNDAVSWISSNGYGIHPEDSFWRGWLTTDLWLMNPDGTGQKQVTFFNVTGHSDYIPGEVVCADNSWSPDGNKLAVTTYLRAWGETHIKIINFFHRGLICFSDYNGDGTSDIGIFRRSSGLWAIRGITQAYFGAGGDQPVPGDYNGDGTTEFGIFRSTRGLWALRGVSRIYFGTSSDQPVPGDYNGDISCDPGIFRPSSGLWAVRGVTRAYFGKNGDTPVPGDYDGDGTREFGLFRSSPGLWALRGISRLYFGGGADKAIPGDYNGDGTGDTGIFRPSSGLWAIRGGVTRFYFGKSCDFPLPADYTGSGTDTGGIFREVSGLWAIRDITSLYFGVTGDLPVAK